MARNDPNALRDEAAKAIERGKLDRAIELYLELEGLEPTSPAWSKRLAETYRRKGSIPEAIGAFERSVAKYVEGGFLVQAIAVCKLILQIDPEHSATASMLAQLAPAPARPAVPPAAARVDTPAPRAPSSPPVPPRAPAIRAPTSPGDEGPVRRAPIVRAPTSSGDEGPVRRAPSLRAPTAGGDEPPTPRSPVARAPTPPPLPPVRPPAPPSKVRPTEALEALELATVIPRAKPLARNTGSNYGISILPLDDEEPIVEVGFDDLEPPTQHRVRAKTASVLAATPLFSDMSPGVLDSLVPRMTLVVLEPNEVLFREGEPGDCLYVVSEGEVVVTTNGQELARFGPGSFFGEVALITDQPRSATITAVTRVEVLAIDRDTVRAAAAEQPEIVSVLLRFVRERLIDRMTRTSALFQSFTDDERAALTARFDLLEVSQDVHLIIEGQRTDGLYVIVAGKVEVWRDGAPTPIAVLSTGDVFGEMSLLDNGLATASCTTASRAIALRLPAATFREVIMTHPQVLAYLAEVEASRAPRTAGDDLVGVHLDLL